MRRKFLISICVAIFLFTPPFVSANVVINEICPTGCASADHQWVEIFNPDSSATDLTGWKFWENSTRHGLTISSSSLKQSFSLEPSEYAVITQDDELFCTDHPGFSSAIFDSVWGTLKDDGEEIGLKDNNDNFVEQFTYKTVNNFSLQRKDSVVSASDVGNWCEHESGNTAGAVNVCPIVVETPTTTPPEDETPQPEAGQPLAETTTPTSTTQNTNNITQLRINEFVPNPSSGEEWVEIYNPTTSSITIDGLKLFDSTTERAAPTGTIDGLGFFIIELSDKLNNDGDSIILKDASSTIIDSASYTSVGKGNSIARSVDGAGSFQETTTLTRGTPNVITAPVVNTPSGGGGGGGGGVKPLEAATPQPPDLFINELVSDPSDGEVEFVEIYNKGSQTTNLTGWWIEEGSGSRNVLNGSITPLGFFVLEKPSGSLNNAGDIVKLFSSSGTEVDKVAYGNWNDGSVSNNAVAASDPFSLARKTDGYDTNNDHSNFVITARITKGGPNVVVSTMSSATTTTFVATPTTSLADEKEENTLPMISILLPEEIVVGEPMEFDASETIDLEEDELSFVWDFGDGSRAYGETVLHEYKEDGTFTISLVVKDGTGQSKETAKVKVTSEVIGDQLSVINDEVVETRLRSNSVGTSARQGGSYLGVVSLDKMSEVSAGDKVKVGGTVAVLPNVFGSQYFYIANGSNGVQIYMNSKKFPQLRIGDVVEVSGEISEPYGEKRVKVKNTTDIRVIGHTDNVLPAELTTVDLSESVGAFVKLKGEITEMKSTYLYVDDGEGEVKVVFKRGANIGKGDRQIGDLVEIMGVVGQSSSGIQLMPRSQMDIVKVGHVEEDPSAGSGQAKNETTETYLTATAGGLTSILISLAAKARGKVALGLLKRVGGLAMLVVKRKTKV